MTKSERIYRSLSYIANVRIPSEKANSIQILKMCDAFCSSGCAVELVTPFRFQRPGMGGLSGVHEVYSLTNRFPIRKIYSPDFMPLGAILPFLSGLLFFLQSIIFAFLVVMRSLIVRKRLWYYTRDLWVALFMSVCFPSRVAFELHTVPFSAARRFALREIIRRCVPIASVTAAMKRILVEEMIYLVGLK